MHTLLRKSLPLFTFLALLFPLLVDAETRIVADPVGQEVIWTKEASPYILEAAITIKPDQTLILGPGVVVTSAVPPEKMGSEFFTFWVDGNLIIAGTKEDPVHLQNLWSISTGKTATIRHATFENTAISIYKSTVTISSSRFINSSTGIEAEGSSIDIRDSEFINLSRGVVSTALAYPSSHGAPNDPVENRISIHNSSFVGIKKAAVYNLTRNTLDASGNWWGSPGGPSATSTVTVPLNGGALITFPWLLEKPQQSPTVCCSNVLFLPGLKASRLSRPDSGTRDGGLASQLWEPYKNDDVRKLFLTPEGRSSDPSIYVAGVVETAFGLKNVYAKFVAMMNGVVAEKIVNSWLPFAYDWRLSLQDVVLGSTLYATTTKKLMSEVERLALTSKTGKVTIVAHSNGGLVAKMLGYELEKTGKAHLIDKVLLVAVPQLGTPDAIAALLHGSGQSLLGGVVLSANIARTFGMFMPSAHGLLPSLEYFSRIVDPVLTFAGKAMTSYADFIDFLTARGESRSVPKESDLKTAAVLSTNLLEKSTWMHRLLDGWSFPSPIRVISVIGWGIPTTSTIEYSSTSPRFKKTSHGDGTVMAESAGAYGERVYFNQGLFKRDTRADVSHAYILEADPVNSLISHIVSTTSTAAATSFTPSSPYISTQKPTSSDSRWMSWITFSVHSPVDIDVYDSRGGHLGLVPLPSDPTSDILWLENTIGAQYDAIGDERYITLNADDTYTVELKGTGTGSFTFQIQRFEGENMSEVSNVVYTAMPVTPLLTASTTIGPKSPAPPLKVDIDGNGVVDVQLNASAPADPLVHLEAMKIVVLALGLIPAEEEALLEKIRRVFELVKKDSTGELAQKLLGIAIQDAHAHWTTQGLTHTQKQSIVNAFNHILDAIQSQPALPVAGC